MLESLDEIIVLFGGDMDKKMEREKGS